MEGLRYGNSCALWHPDGYFHRTESPEPDAIGPGRPLQSTIFVKMVTIRRTECQAYGPAIQRSFSPPLPKTKVTQQGPTDASNLYSRFPAPKKEVYCALPAFTAKRRARYNHTREQPALHETGSLPGDTLAVLPIYEFPHMILRQRAKKVRKIDRSILRLADDMIDTMRHSRGVGLAANQVGVLRRVVVIQLEEDEEPRTYINPEILHRDGEREVEEACLSVPGYIGMITRAIWVKFQGLDRESRVVRLRAEGLLAQVLEHEIDHLNGILYFDHLKSHQLLREIQPEEDKASAEVAVG